MPLKGNGVELADETYQQFPNGILLQMDFTLQLKILSTEVRSIITIRDFIALYLWRWSHTTIVSYSMMPDAGVGSVMGVLGQTPNFVKK